jgi:hypothetical protein
MKSKIITVYNTLTVADITGDESTVCIGSSITLYNATTGGTWSSSDDTKATVDGGVVSGVSAGSVKISYSKTSGSCTTTKTKTITVIAMPVIPTTNGVDVCYDGKEHSAGVTLNDPGNEEVVWYSAASGDGTTTAPSRTQPGSITAYAVAKNTATDCESTPRVAVTVRIKPSPDYPDLRVRVCPDVIGAINLSKYIDTVDVEATATWSGPLVSAAGVVSTGSLPQSGTLTLMYAMNGGCSTGQQRIAYLEVLKNRRSRMLRDSIVMCYKDAEGLQINQLFGIEADGDWLYNGALLVNGDIGSYVNVSNSGAVVLDGKKLYEYASVPLIERPDGTKTKTVAISYEAHAKCLENEVFTVKIVLTDE